jgi:hypothetical protein
MTKSFEQIAESIVLRIGHIYFRPLMYGMNAGEVEMALDLYHSFWAQLLDKELELSEVVRAVAYQQECGSASFAHRHRLNHPDSSEQERAEYVVEQWRKISKLGGLPIPYPKIRSGFEGNERLKALFPDEEN